ncbi:MAG: hypothetical protein IPM34_05115 [Saprospiraceae bacterium]|nr:hypothetical protein [Saprospiraceae bacterium]
MKNPFKKREKKENPKAEILLKQEGHLIDLQSDDIHPEELQPQGQFLETDEDLGYC